MVAAAGLRAHVMPGRGLSAPVELQAAVGAVGPGSQLTLQTAAGPMKLTVDSQMNQAGYVHAYGYANGQMYAGYVQLAAQNAAAQQALALAPTNGQAQLAQYPPADPYSQQTAYAAAVQQWGVRSSSSSGLLPVRRLQHKQRQRALCSCTLALTGV